jgi:multidrug efflux pump subunit AcrB
VASVAPFLLITGLAALIFRELILTISFAIIASLPLALTLVPMLAAQLGKVRFTSGLDRFKPLVAFDHGFDRMVRLYRRLAVVAVRNRGKVLTLAAALLIAAGWAATTIDATFLPPVDDGSVGAFVRLPPGSTPQQTNRTVEEVEAMMKEMPGVVSVFATAGGFFFGGATSTSSGRGSVDVRLVPAGDREVTAEEWVTLMRTKVEERGIAGANVWVRPPRIRGLRTSSSGDAMTLNLVGDDLAELETIGREIARKLQGIPGLANFDVQTDEPAPLLAIVLDRERARALGLDVATVGQTLRTALDGTVATRYAEGNLEYDVRVMFPRGRFTSASDLGDVALFPGQSGGAPIALREVADVHNAVGPTNIRRENQNRMIRLSGDVLTNIAPVGAVADSIEARLAGLQLPDGYGIVLSGDQEAIQESNRQMLLVVGLAIFLVFVVLAVQYESLVDPLVILVAIPTSMVGVIAILMLTGTPFSAPVLLGMIMLAGIVVNNSILLVEFIEHYRHERGVAPEEAVVEAGAVRMRPIMMTTITSLVGMLPLALGLGSGGELMRPLAIAAVGGLTASTLLTLFVVPCAYLVVHSAGDGVREFLLGKKSAPPAAPRPAEVAGD